MSMVERQAHGSDASASAHRAAQADVETQPKERTTAMMEQAAEKTALVADRIRVQTLHAAQLVKDTTPEPVLHKAGQVATVARANRKPLLVGGAGLALLLLVRRGRGRR
ncbi:hypothetical protein ACWGE1_32135 [Streptomyces sp. NPDC054932]